MGFCVLKFWDFAKSCLLETEKFINVFDHEKQQINALNLLKNSLLVFTV